MFGTNQYLSVEERFIKLNQIHFRCGTQLQSPEKTEKCSNCGRDLAGLDKFSRSMSEFHGSLNAVKGELADCEVGTTLNNNNELVRLAKEGQQDALTHLLQVSPPVHVHVFDPIWNGF